MDSDKKQTNIYLKYCFFPGSCELAGGPLKTLDKTAKGSSVAVAAARVTLPSGSERLVFHLKPATLVSRSSASTAVYPY